MRNKFFNNSKKRSFTLVEVLVVIALIAIVGTLIISMLIPTSNMFGLLTYRTEVKMKADQAMKILVEQIRFAQELEISYDSNLLYIDADKNKLYCQDGKIYVINPDETKDLFSDDYYDKYSISFTAEKIENNLINLTCSVVMKSDSSIQYSITTVVKVYNTQQITGTEGNIFSYYWGESE